jgi:hypothetical protein
MGEDMAHYIEVLSESEEEEAEHAYDIMQDISDVEEAHDEVKSGDIDTLSIVPRFHTFKIHGVVQGQWVIVLIDSGKTHNFINSTLVAKRGIPTVDFEGFDVVVAGGCIITEDPTVTGCFG